MVAYPKDLLNRIYLARARASQFFTGIVYKETLGWAYTSTHDIQRYPAGLLYGTWAGILGICLLKETSAWDVAKKNWAVSTLDRYRDIDGVFLPTGVANKPTNKSIEYLKLHCTNYSLGALLELDPGYDFESPYMNRFMDADFLRYWLEGRSLLRPWEESNNLVNVIAYIALLNDHGHPNASARLEQLLDWHRNNQNPSTGGFDAFHSPNYKQRIESLAGAVHNFHLYLYLNEPFQYEEKISEWVARFLVQGQLTACFSIDFVELAVRTLSFTTDKQKLVNALVYHADALLASQNGDGGWAENDTDAPSVAEGFKDHMVSSCTYSTWFRLASLGMIAASLLGDEPENWGFRKTLGMGYAPDNWPYLGDGIEIRMLSMSERISILRETAPRKVMKKLVSVGTKLLYR